MILEHPPHMYGLKQVVQVVTVVTRLFSLGFFCHHLVTTVTITPWLHLSGVRFQGGSVMRAGAIA